MEPIDLNLRDIYRASDVTRWGIVKVARNQSVAEHSFQVAMITQRICQELGCLQAVTDLAVRYALFHDLPEVLTGDLATPLKELIGPEALRALSDLEESITYLGQPMPRNERVREMVKLADLIEAVAFLHGNVMTDHGRQVQAAIYRKVQDHYYGGTAMKVLTEILSATETTIDSLAGRNTHADT